MPKSHTTPTGWDTKIKEILRVLIEEDKNNEGLSRSFIRRTSDIHIEARSLDNFLKILKRLHSIEYRPKKSGDKRLRISITDIGRMNYTGEIMHDLNEPMDEITVEDIEKLDKITLALLTTGDFIPYPQIKSCIQNLQHDFDNKDVRLIYFRKILEMLEKNITPDIINDNVGLKNIIKKIKDYLLIPI